MLDWVGGNLREDLSVDALARRAHMSPRTFARRFRAETGLTPHAWVVGQRLVPKVGGGRWAVHDILSNTIRSNELILLGESEGKTFYEIQEVGEPFGMMTFDQSLLRSYEHGIVTALVPPTGAGLAATWLIASSMGVSFQ